MSFDMLTMTSPLEELEGSEFFLLRQGGFEEILFDGGTLKIREYIKCC